MTERTWEVIRGVLVLVVSTAVISSAISLYRLAQDHAPVVFTAGAEQRPLETHTWDQNTDNSPKQMLKTSEGICFLASVSGDFNGPGEELSVAPEDGVWVFRGRAGTQRDYGLNGTARCWRFPWVR